MNYLHFFISCCTNLVNYTLLNYILSYSFNV